MKCAVGVGHTDNVCTAYIVCRFLCPTIAMAFAVQRQPTILVELLEFCKEPFLEEQMQRSSIELKNPTEKSLPALGARH